MIPVTIISAVLFWLYWQNNIPDVPQNNQPVVQNDASQNNNLSTDQTIVTPSGSNIKNTTGFQAPLDRAQERITKKPFGIYITSENSPIRPERFGGYHTGTDFEIFPEELDIDVPVKAVCSGKLLQKKYASGYGGVVVETCELDGSPITVVYGHLKLESISAKAGDAINAGSTLGILGKDKSPETDGERKHLHLGFHKGKGINILGYIQKQPELSGWIDPCFHVCSN